MKLLFLKQNKEKGITAILLAILVLSVMLVITLSLTTAFISEVKSSAYIDKTTPVYYAAESGAEYALYKIKENSPSGTKSFQLKSLSDAQCQVIWDQNQGKVESTGKYQGVQRKVAIYFE